MSLLTVCPVITPPKPGLLESWNRDEHLVVVNGARRYWLDELPRHSWHVHVPHEPKNLGCPASWNIGFEFARDNDISHVAILSQSLIIDGGTSRLATRVAVHCGVIAPWARVILTQHSFHAIVISVKIWEHLGGFDETLPVWGDIDFIRRAWLHDPNITFGNIDVPGSDERCAALRAGAVTEDVYHADKVRYAAKWGGPCGHERYTQPFDPTSTTDDTRTPTATPGSPEVRLKPGLQRPWARQ